jgi:hypothetical protein
MLIDASVQLFHGGKKVSVNGYMVANMTFRQHDNSPTLHFANKTIRQHDNSRADNLPT